MNGKIYIGSHKTTNLNDGYMGSGKYLKRAIEKHGIDNFVKEVLFVFDTPEQMYAKEAEIVTEDFLTEENTYNLKVGGFGGWDYVNEKGINNQGKDKDLISDKISKRLKGRKVSLSQVQSLKQRHKDGNLRHSYFGNRDNDAEFRKNAWSDEAKEKRKVTRDKIEFQKGRNNSQYGTCWIYHYKHGPKKINKSLLPDYLLNDWIVGRVDKDKKKAEKQIINDRKKRKFEDKQSKLAKETRRLYLDLRYTSVRAFVRDGHFSGSNQRLLNLWRKHILNFEL